MKYKKLEDCWKNNSDAQKLSEIREKITKLRDILTVPKTPLVLRSYKKGVIIKVIADGEKSFKAELVKSTKDDSNSQVIPFLTKFLEKESNSYISLTSKEINILYDFLYDIEIGSE